MSPDSQSEEPSDEAAGSPGAAAPTGGATRPLEARAPAARATPSGPALGSANGQASAAPALGGEGRDAGGAPAAPWEVRPIRLYGLSPAGELPRRPRPCCAAFCAALLVGCLGALARARFAVEQWLTSRGVSARLPWLRPELWPLGAALLLGLLAALGFSRWRRSRAHAARAVLYADAVEIRRGKQSVRLEVRDLVGYRLPGSETVLLRVRAPRRSWEVLPAPNPVVRALVVDWLEGHGIERFDG
ncbi:MAG: hypothetical protein D6731_17520 [Planctomycetota bacterium]|nr:MAG: hypothetical protein D6731_17520 [Planctomycetota bacterium]